ncbi:hypothetical protein [Polyangium fumosum]|uniref:Uncharacterized protein n=1 Tax=Polyangium fumosum TaxID=889272 RepID=A0A4V5PN99_9BACT|nr:hypothetical protein [Polyangium fumosum]TKC99796.1 hypothetical protein E8A74_36760 [Polyangium fumosum]
MNKRVSCRQSNVRLGAVTALLLAGCTTDVDIARSRGERCTSGQAFGVDPGGAQACKRGACVWSKRFDSQYRSSVASATLDRSGNLLIAGQFQGNLDLGGEPLKSATGAWYLAKRDAQGNHVWSKQLRGSVLDIMSVATDPWENVVLTGAVDGIVDFGGGPLHPAGGRQRDMFVAKFAADGSYRWSKLFGVDHAYDCARQVKIDAMGSVIVCGIRENEDDTAEGILLKLKEDGNDHWKTKLAGGSKFMDISCAADSVGNVFVGGNSALPLRVDGYGLTKSGSLAMFLAKFDANGKPLWNKQLDRDGDISSFDDVAVDSQGGVIVVGSLAGVANLSGCPLVSDPEGSEAFMAKFDAMGNHVRTTQIRSIRAPSLMTAGAGATIVGGYVHDDTLPEATDRDLHLDGCPLANGSASAFLFKLDDAGDIRRIYFLDRTWAGGAAAIDQDHNIFLAGSFEGTIDLGCGPMTSVGDEDIVIAKLAP